MEIKIQSLESIHEAAREFIAAMGDNTVFASFYLINLVSLLLDSHILMNNADAALSRNGNCHS